jgi:hypothetical protein
MRINKIAVVLVGGFLAGFLVTLLYGLHTAGALRWKTEPK